MKGNPLKYTSIEIIFDECGWTYKSDEMAWRIEKFIIKQSSLHKLIEEGRGIQVRNQIIETLSKRPACDNPNIQATIERLKTKSSKK